MLRELHELNTRVAEQTAPPPPTESKPAPAYAFLHLVRPPVFNMTRIGSSSYQQPAGEPARAGYSS